MVESINDNIRVKKKFPFINILLFVITFIATLFAGAFQNGSIRSFQDLLSGIPFSISLMLILLIHELGHYFFAKKHRVNVTLPYFIPGPVLPSPFFSVGTFGAFIMMKSKVKEKNALFDIGMAGPLLGFIFSTIALIIGLLLSEVREIELKSGFIFGESVLIKLLVKLVIGSSSDDITILLHPIGVAGWFGYFITFINLIPIGQLDGGHIFYAVFGKMHKFFTKVFIAVLLIFGIIGWKGWIFWSILLIFVGIKHPTLCDFETELSQSRKILALLMLLIFISIFMLNPFSIM